MKFRYYITNVYEGVIDGTNSPNVAKEFSLDEDYFVVDSEAGEWLRPDGTQNSVKDVEEIK